jgi:acetylornithine deacetylase/succinyl-diaminopimelate desuccinylase-like protein
MSTTDRILDLAVQIQQIPSPTFDESRRAAFIRDQFDAQHLKDVMIDSLGNVYGKLPGENSEQSLVLTAHSDTVFPSGTDLKIVRGADQIHGPGIGDNSLGIAGLIGLLWMLREGNISLPGDLWLVANVCEEGLGDLKGMRAVVDRFGDRPLAYIVVEGMALGQVYHRGLGVQRYRITAITEGGHSWVDYGKPSAIHELAEMITKLTTLEIPQEPRTTLNVGVIHGGTSVNTIAAQASLELDLRSVDPSSLSGLVQQVELLVSKSSHSRVDYQIEIIGQRPAGELSKKHPLVTLAMDVLKEVGISPKLNIGSTDANIPLSQGLPSVCIGLTNGKGAHTVNEYIYTQPLEEGMAQLVQIAEKAFQALA